MIGLDPHESAPDWFVYAVGWLLVLGPVTLTALCEWWKS